MHLNVNSVLPIIDKLRNDAKLSNKIHIDFYNILHRDQNGHYWGAVVCSIRNDLNYDVKSFFRLKLKIFSLNYDTNNFHLSFI